MLAIPVVNMQGKRVGEVEVDPALFGGSVRPQLLKQAVVTFLDRQRQRSARTKGRSDVEGSTRKLYRQKGTGHARAGAIRTPLRRGGGRTFGKRVPGAFKTLPKKMRRMARNSAILAKIEAQDVMILSELECSEPKTKPFAAMLTALGADTGCLLALEAYNDNVYRSGRNIPKTDIRVVDDLNAYEVLLRRKLIFTRPAFERLTQSAVPRTQGSQDE